jgi:hypothetical protein
MPGKLSKRLKRLIHSGSYNLSNAAKKAGLEPDVPIPDNKLAQLTSSIEKAKAKANSKSKTIHRSKSATQLGGRRRRTRKHKSRKHRTRKY